MLVGGIALSTRDLLGEICTEKGLSFISGNDHSNPIHLHVSVPAFLSPTKRAQLMKGKSFSRLQPELPQLRKKYGGQHLAKQVTLCVPKQEN